ncbi:MAG: hypothetical protein WA764_23060, partial [Pseudolabrys sp.]
LPRYQYEDNQWFTGECDQRRSNHAVATLIQFQSRVGITDVSSWERIEASCVGLIRPVFEGGQYA